MFITVSSDLTSGTYPSFLAAPGRITSHGCRRYLFCIDGVAESVRNHSGLANVRAKIGSEYAEVTFAGAEGILPGVDQVTLRLQPSLRGRGEVSVELSVDGRAANTVRIKLK
jgi:hypothetical protein